MTKRPYFTIAVLFMLVVLMATTVMAQEGWVRCVRLADGEIVTVDRASAEAAAQAGICRILGSAVTSQPAQPAFVPQPAMPVVAYTCYMIDNRRITDVPVMVAAQWTTQGVCLRAEPQYTWVVPPQPVGLTVYGSDLMVGQSGGYRIDRYGNTVPATMGEADGVRLQIGGQNRHRFDPPPMYMGYGRVQYNPGYGQPNYGGYYPGPGMPVYGADLMVGQSGGYRVDRYGNTVPASMAEADGVRLQIGGQSRHRFDPPPVFGPDGRIYYRR